MSETRPEFWQRESIEDTAAEAARGWIANPANKMSLPQNNKAADADGDGLVDSKEFQQLFDLDGDGNLSQHELDKAAKLFAMVDKDGDGQLTEEEMKQVPRTRVYILLLASRPVCRSLLRVPQLAHARDKKVQARNH